MDLLQCMGCKRLNRGGWQGPVDVEKDFITPYNNREPSHRNNIWAAKGAVTKISGCLVRD